MILISASSWIPNGTTCCCYSARQLMEKLTETCLHVELDAADSRTLRATPEHNHDTVWFYQFDSTLEAAMALAYYRQLVSAKSSHENQAPV